jgi:hypothetical protein
VKKLKERIRDEIYALYSNGHLKPSNVAKEYPRLYLKARKIFGSWKKALEASGIDYEAARNRKKWSRERVLKEIERLCLKGQSLRPKDIKREGMTDLISAASYHFGSWRRAVESSGILYSCGRRKKAIQTGERKEPNRNLRSTHLGGK